MASPLRDDFDAPSQQPPKDADFAEVTEKPPLAAAVEKLESISIGLRYVQFLLPLATLLCLVLVLLCALRVLPAVVSVYAIFSGGFSLIVIVLNEIAVKRGNVLFEEISDELQWHIAPERMVKPERPPDDAPASNIAQQRPAINVRVVLRSFALATDLPLLPGRYGPAFYTLINLVLVFLSAWQMNGFFHR